MPDRPPVASYGLLTWIIVIVLLLILFGFITVRVTAVA